MSQKRNLLNAAAAALFAALLLAVPGVAFGQAAGVEQPQAVPAGGAATVSQEKLPASEAAKTEGGEKKEEANSQEEQEKKFREDGAIVKWLAGVTGWSRATAANVFMWLNFAIIFFGVAIPIGRKLPQIFKKRASTLSQSLDEARKATADANTRLSAVEAKLAGLDAEIAKFRTQVEEESKADEARIKSTIEEEKARIVAAAEQELTVAAAQARRNLRTFAADLAITQATAQLKLTPEADKALIAEFVANAAEGGKN